MITININFNLIFHSKFRDDYNNIDNDNNIHSFKFDSGLKFDFKFILCFSLFKSILNQFKCFIKVSIKLSSLNQS